MSDISTKPKGSKKKLIIGSVAALGAAAIIGVSGAHAANSNPVSSLVDAIASRFNLNKTDVQQVFDQQHTQQESQRQQTVKDRLQTAVDQGKITADQRDKILAKLDELNKTRDGLKDKTPEERRTAMKTQLDDLKKWASDNNIPVQYLMGLGGPGGMGHMRGHGGMMRPDGDADDGNNTQPLPSISPDANGTNSTSGSDSGQLL